MSKKKKDIPISDNQLLLLTGEIITFNDEQYDGINKIRRWLKNEQVFFTLAGHAGTGKSSITKKILEEYHGYVVVSAPTHKALGVIEGMTGIDGKTIQSLLGLRPDCDATDFNPNDPQFAQIAKPKIDDYDFVIVDECSMINSELFLFIKNLIRDKKIKILFVGDPAQIPPVGEKISEVFHQSDIECHWLTKVERQKSNNPIVFVYDKLRDNLNLSDGGFIKKTNINKNGEGIDIITNKSEFRKIIIEKFKSEEFKINNNFARIIAWRNTTVMSANKIIRTSLFGENNDLIEIGDVIMGYRSIRSLNGRYNIIDNSTDYKIIDKSEQTINKYGIIGYQVHIKENNPYKKTKEKNIFIVDTDNIDNLHNYAELHDKLKTIGKEKIEIDSWKEYYSFRRQNIIMKDIKKYRNGETRDKYNKIVKDIDYGYAITGHRSQGSTYQIVMVLYDDIYLNPKIKERNQIFYVAITRPTKCAYVLCDDNNL